MTFMPKLILNSLFVLLFNYGFGLTISGKTTENINTSIDSVYVGIIWHYGDTKPHLFNKSVGKIKEGYFKLKIDHIPPTESILTKKNIKLSVGYIVLFKDKNGDKLFDTNDEIVGVCENNCVTYLKGNINTFLDSIEKSKEKKITTLRHLKNGLCLVKVVKPNRQIERNFFDDLVPIKLKEIIIKVGERKNLEFPNWT